MSCDSPQHEAAEGGPPGRLKKGKKCGGCKGKKPCAKCSAAKAMKEDALTTKEYLAACDLGVEHKSRTYIRARLDASGKGKKCGGSSISAGKKCNKGGGGAAPMQAQSERGKKIRGALKTAGKVALVAGGIAALAYGASKTKAAGDFSTGFREAYKEGKQKQATERDNRNSITQAFKDRDAAISNRKKSLEKLVMKNRAAAWGDRANKREQVRKALGR